VQLLPSVFTSTALTLLASLASAALAQTPAPPASPSSMMRIVIRDVSAGLPAEHFGRLPKVIYRSGSCCMRLEEQKNPETGLHLVFITRAPDTWVLDLDQMLAGHTVDETADKAAHMPVLWTDGLSGLEFGTELAFMREKSATRDGPVACGSQRCDRQSVEHNGYKVVLLTLVGRDQPAQISIGTPAGEQIAFAYDAYETGLPMKAELFSLPPGTQLLKSRPETPPEGNTGL